MTRVVYFTAATLDGFIADENHSLDWLFEVPHGEDDGGWDGFISRIGALVLGASTWEWMEQRHGVVANPAQWREFYGDRPGWVLPRRITSGRMRFREVRQAGQRVRLVLDVTRT